MCVGHQKNRGREVIDRDRNRVRKGGRGGGREGGRERRKRERERQRGRESEMFRNNLIFQKKILK